MNENRSPAEGSFEKYLRHSGDFVKTVALAIQRADLINRARLERAYPQMVAAHREHSWFDAPPGFKPHYQAADPADEHLIYLLPKATPFADDPVPDFCIRTVGTVPDFATPELSLDYYRSHADQIVGVMRQSLPGGLTHALLESFLREYCLYLRVPLVGASEEVRP